MTSAIDPLAAATFRRTERVLDAMPRAIVVTDVDGVIVGWNRVSEALYGWAAEQVIGARIGDVVEPATKAHFLKLGIQPLSSTPEEFRSYLRAEIERWAPVIQVAGATED